MSSTSSLLVVVLEINQSLFVKKNSSRKSLHSFANAIVAFLKSHHLLNRGNRSMTIACGNNRAEFLAQENYDSTTYATFSSSLASRIEKFDASGGGGGLGSALSMALCHIRKYVFRRRRRKLRARNTRPTLLHQVNTKESRSSFKNFSRSHIRRFFIPICFLNEQYFLCS